MLVVCWRFVEIVKALREGEIAMPRGEGCDVLGARGEAMRSVRAKHPYLQTCTNKALVHNVLALMY